MNPLFFLIKVSKIIFISELNFLINHFDKISVNNVCENNN